MPGGGGGAEFTHRTPSTHYLTAGDSRVSQWPLGFLLVLFRQVGKFRNVMGDFPKFN